MHTSARVRRRVLPVRDRSAAECHGHQQGQEQQRRTPVRPSPPHRAHTGSCTPSKLLPSGTAISSTQRCTHDDVTSINIQNTHTRRADLKKSGTERKECARAAPGAAGAEVVETQHEKWISMPVRSHCSWRGAAQRAPSIPASSPHLLGASCRKTQECSKHQRSANRHSCPRCRTFHSMRVFWLLLELHEDAPLLELFSRHF